MLNLPPTFKSVSWTGIIVYRIVEGKVVEEQGFSRTNLLYMRAFAEAYPDEQIVQQVVG